MKRALLLLTLPLALATLAAEDAAAPPSAPGGGKTQAEPSPAPDPEQQRLEQVFRETLTNAIMKGRWRDSKDGELGPEKEDQYTIQKVEKVGGDAWTIWARIQYGKADVTLPVPVRVKWAGDTPVISVTDAGLPGLGTYTARVMVYRNLYTGTWFGPGHGGLLSGTIERNQAAEPTRAGATQAESKQAGTAGKKDS